MSRCSLDLAFLFASFLLIGPSSNIGWCMALDLHQSVQETTPPHPVNETPVKPAIGCHLEEIIPHTGERLQEFVENVNRISATEVLEHERLNKDGKQKEHELRKFNYVVVMAETGPGVLSLDEFRDGQTGTVGFPGEIASMGMPTLALIFHPGHRDEFDMSCENLSTWQDHQVWRVHFRQRKDKPSRMCVLQVGQKVYPISLEGMAWIDSETFQIVHLETDIVEPIPEVRLVSEHQVLDYGPVLFKGKNLTLWLPQDADIVLDSGGKRFHQLHTFTDYEIFSVDYGQKISAPKSETNP